MAKPLNERLSKALTNTAVRSTELEVLIEEAEAEIVRLTGTMGQSNADAINLGLSDDDRDAAAATADRTRREILGLGKAVEGLTAKLAARVASEEKQATAARRASLLADRDRIAERMAAEWPAIEAAIVELLGAVTANEADMRAAGIHEANAEAVARGLPGNFARGPVQFRQLTKLALPSFTDGHELAWPVTVRSGKHFSEMAEEERRRQIKVQRRRDAAEAAAWADYVLSPGKIDRITEVSCHGGAVMTLFPASLAGAARSDSSPRPARLHANEAARLQRLGMTVELVS